MRNSEKLNLIISQLCESKAQFCKLVGIAPSTLSSWLSRDMLDPFAIAAALPVRAEWLLRTEGPMLISDEYETVTKETIEPTEEQTETARHTDGYITIPSSVLEDYSRQLAEKDKQISEKDNQLDNIIKLLNKV